MDGVRRAGCRADGTHGGDSGAERRRLLRGLVALPATAVAAVVGGTSISAAGADRSPPAAGDSRAAGDAAGAGGAGAPPRRVRLAIRFVTTRDGADHERGRETAEYDVHDDGHVVVRIHSESDSPSVVRDAIYTLDRDWRPLDCLLRLQTDGRYEGNGWFRFEPDAAYCEGWNARGGRISQRVPLSTPVTAFVAHPVSTDVMLAAAFDRTRGTGMQRVRGVFMSSADPYGRTGPMLAPSDVWVEYRARTTLDTPAGPRPADHYALYLPQGDGPAREPLQELWCLAGTAIFLRAAARGEYRTRYELTRFESA